MCKIPKINAIKLKSVPYNLPSHMACRHIKMCVLIRHIICEMVYGPYINTFQTILRNICLSVILEFCLLSVVCSLSASAAYTSLYRGLKYLLITVNTDFDGMKTHFQLTKSSFWTKSSIQWKIKCFNEMISNLISMMMFSQYKNLCV